MGIFESKGIKRALGLIFLVAGEIPQLAAYKEALVMLGSFFGLTGVIHATTTGKSN